MKKGFTLIEMLVTTVIFGLFLIICYPLLNNITNKFNLINDLQINTLNNLRLYQKLTQINEFSSEIYYELNDGLRIKIEDNEIIFKDNLYINEVYYNVTLNDYIIKKNIIILNYQSDDESYKIILRGVVNEIC